MWDTGLWGRWVGPVCRASGLMASCGSFRHTVGTSCPGRALGCREPGLYGSICLTVLFAPASYCSARDGTCPYLLLGQGGVWAAGGWATYPTYPEAPPIPKDATGSRIRERPILTGFQDVLVVASEQPQESRGAQGHTGDSIPSSPTCLHSSRGQEPGTGCSAHLTFPRALPGSLPHTLHCSPW